MLKIEILLTRPWEINSLHEASRCICGWFGDDDPWHNIPFNLITFISQFSFI